MVESVDGDFEIHTKEEWFVADVVIPCKNVRSLPIFVRSRILESVIVRMCYHNYNNIKYERLTIKSQDLK